MAQRETSSTAGEITRLTRDPPINKLPLELLTRIFWLTVPPFKGFDAVIQGFWWPNIARVAKTRELVPLTHVCKGWRAIALQTPFLWSSINGSNNLAEPQRAALWAARAPPSIPTADAFLARSASIPINIFAQRDLHPSVLSMCRNHSSRIQELHLFCIDDKVEKIVSLTDFPAPCLEYVTVHAAQSMGYARGLPPTGSYTVSLFRGQASMLRYLTWQIGTCLPSNQFLSLTHLSIRPVISAVHHQWQLTDLLTLLSGCPALQELVLARLQDSLRYDDVPSVALASLRKIRVGWVHPTLATWLIEHIIPIENATVHIESTTDTCPSSCRPARMPMYRGELARVFLSTDMNDVITTVTAVGVTSGGICVEWASNRYRRKCPACLHWAPSLWAVWPLASTRELWISEHVDPEWLGGYPTIFRSLPCLKTIFFCESVYPKFRFGKYFDAFVAALSARCTNGVSAFCPRLKTLHLYLVTEAVGLETLAQLNAARRALGCPLESIVVEYIADTAWRPGRFSDKKDLPQLGDHHEFIEYRLREDPPQLYDPSLLAP